MYCGPVLTELLGVMAPYQDRVQIVHVEIYKDQTSDALVPTVDAWALPGEPWLFGIDGAGTVVGPPRRRVRHRRGHGPARPPHGLTAGGTIRRGPAAGGGPTPPSRAASRGGRVRTSVGPEPGPVPRGLIHERQ